MTLALATLGELPADGAAWARGTMPAATPLEELDPLGPEIAGAPAFMRNYDMRPALHEDARRRPRAPGCGPAQPRALDAPLAAAMTDAWAPVAFTALERASSRRRSTSRSTSPPPPAGRPRQQDSSSAASPAASGRRRREEHGELRADGELLVHRASSRSYGRRRRQPHGYLGLGSNVGDRRANLQAAVDALPAHGVRVLTSSSTYDTEPVGEGARPAQFLDACIRIGTGLAPEELLDACKAVERDSAAGRAASATGRGRSTWTSSCSATNLSLARLSLPRAGDEPPLRFCPAGAGALDLTVPGAGCAADGARPAGGRCWRAALLPRRCPSRASRGRRRSRAP